MTSLSARIPDHLEDELNQFIEDENLDRSTAVRKLLSEGLQDWRREKALQMLDDGEISLSKAAEIANMDIWSFSDLVKKEKITWVEDDRVREDIEAV